MYRKIYFMGIKGVGMATLAVMAKEAGFVVGGSDVEEEFITDKILKKAGINVVSGFKKENVDGFVSGLNPSEVLFIATGAHDGFDNVEAEWAKNNGIKVITHGEAVGIFMDGEIFERKFEGISIAGAHGKTTISAMIASCLVSLGMDPSYTVGTSEINPIGSAGHYGKGKYFVAEADEYLAEGKHDRTPKFLYQHPKFLIINNIDFDHPDFFEDIASVRAAYKKFISNLPPDGLLIINGDDENIKQIVKAESKSIFYGANEENEFIIKAFREEGFGSRFEVLRNNTSLGEFKLQVPGYHNAKNSLAVITLLIELGISIQDIKRVLGEFEGCARRFEKVGVTESGVLVFDDYAHHPEEIRKTLEALKLAFPDKKTTVIFQAHTFARTNALINSFVSAFGGVWELILLPTFVSARDGEDHDISEDMEFVEKIRMVQHNVKLIETKEGVIEYLRKNIVGSDKIIFTMGAGDVYKVAEQLVA